MDDWKNWEGRIIDQRFRLSDHLGGGSHSAVFLTNYDGAKAAIKLVPATDHTTPDWDRALRLDHPNLLRLLHTGRVNEDGKDVLYAVMEYADDDLSKVLPERALTAQETRDVLPPVLNALEYLHQRGLVHGHLKASNILATGDQIKLASDGISSSGQKSHDVKSVYDAPEIAATGYTAQSDIWALGVTLVEMLTQRAGNHPDYKKLPARLADVVRECLQADPQRRPPAAAIPAILSGQRLPEPKVSPAAQPEDRERKVAGSRRSVAILTGALLLGAIVIIGPRLIDSSPAPVAGVATAPTPAAAPPPAKLADAKGEVIDRILPKVESKAQRTIRGKLRVQVHVSVDEAGMVKEAKLESRGGSRYFSNQALGAARRWKFKPPVANGRNTPSDWNLTFEFTRSDIKATAQERQSS
jgi:TonB family protein